MKFFLNLLLITLFFVSCGGTKNYDENFRNEIDRQVEYRRDSTPPVEELDYAIIHVIDYSKFNYIVSVVAKLSDKTIYETINVDRVTKNIYTGEDIIGQMECRQRMLQYTMGNYK